ncbi:MAG: VWA domain-containing protein [Flavobacteriales bacterium]|nr:VWA domain-containing protein [Flavobacteriales bacterium]
MKKIISSILSIAFVSAALAQGTPPSDKKVQVAILFDTSNSMDNLIDQAKSRIWNIVNEISELRFEGELPIMEFSLYEYGNDGLDKKDNYLRQVLNFTSDLDDLSQKMFALRTNGGSEYCGAVIQKALDDLAWTNNQDDLKMIYIAGNEEFDQGKIDYRKACTNAKSKSVYINSIFCGDYNEGVRMKWFDGADCSGGDFFNIDANKEIVHIPTPYDKEIQLYNDSLNSTYYGYGVEGIRKKEIQMSEDLNAGAMSTSVAAERSISKSKKGVYKNASWDLVDAVEEGKDIAEIEEKELPEEFKNKTTEEKLALIEAKKEERENYQAKIGELALLRENYIADEKKRRAEQGEEVDDFGSSVNQSIEKRAKSIGFVKEANTPE